MCGVAPFLGHTVMSPLEVMGSELDADIFFQLRLPRVVTAFLVGMALALGGVAFQAVFRNALATPFTLGVSGGATLGATVASFFLRGLVGGAFLVQGGAFAGALVAVALVYAISRMRRGFSTSDLLLAGVAVSFLFSSLVMLFQYIGNPHDTVRMVHWMMGSVSVSGFQSVVPLLFPVLLGLLVLGLSTRELDLLLLGDDLALSRGLRIHAFRQLLFLAVSFMIAACVAVCGPIGFIGLMVPHICRRLVGARHRHLVPASALLGGLLLVACDTLARTLIFPAEMPIGIITALLGAPFFLWLLYSGKTEL
ncbi:MAG: iron ABC transporter permease [Kiritimatiellaeota bacterium]|nr:iron ABC transporter permease [Kiritimatiellota bacterium]